MRLGWLRQELEDLDPSMNVLQAVEDVANYVTIAKKELSASQLAERLGFSAKRQRTPVGDLSGGERRRLQFTRVLMSEPNLLLLDEPTNDLDIDTLQELESLLDGWAGTLVVISHDRYLIERIADSTWALFGDHLRHKQAAAGVLNGGYTAGGFRPFPAIQWQKRACRGRAVARLQACKARYCRRFGHGRCSRRQCCRVQAYQIARLSIALGLQALPGRSRQLAAMRLPCLGSCITQQTICSHAARCIFNHHLAAQHEHFEFGNKTAQHIAPAQQQV